MDDVTTLGTVVLGIDDFVLRDAQLVAGEVVLEVETTAARIGCIDCGVVAVAHGRRIVHLRDLAMAGRPCRLVWAKRIWRCQDRRVLAGRGRNGVMTWCCHGIA